MKIIVPAKIVLFTVISVVFMACQDKQKGHEIHESDHMKRTERKAYALVIHGGAGTITRENMTPEREKEYTEALNAALDAGIEVLSAGGRAEDAVIAAIELMENSPLFNAGKGSVFTHDGRNEMDASIMRGRDLEAGAVGGVATIMNPIKAALTVMEASEHVMLVGEGAEVFAKKQGLEMRPPEYFYTEKRWQSLQNILAREKDMGAHITAMADSKYGTVGAVALDTAGNLVAGTSTGGMTNKRYDRIGDSPIIGAGTYADNRTCGVSATGHGEFFIRYAVAHDISALMDYKGMSVEEASRHVIHDKLVAAGGDGGVIAMDRYGNISMPFNTAGMYRGYADDTSRKVLIYKEE